MHSNDLPDMSALIPQVVWGKWNFMEVKAENGNGQNLLFFIIVNRVSIAG